jgi:cytochrome c553
MQLGNLWIERLLAVFCVVAAFLIWNRAEAAEDNAVATEQRMGSGLPVQGKRKIKSENCQECHGESGVGLAPSAPKLAGQYADYIIKQLRDFQSGERKHPVMSVMAEALTDDDRADIAAHYSGSPLMQGEAVEEDAVARELYFRGDMSRNIMPCKSCHGETGKGKYSATGCYPVIGGQHMIYLREQLRNWRKGERNNSSGGVMNVIARSLSDAEIEALSNFISGM